MKRVLAKPYNNQFFVLKPIPRYHHRLHDSNVTKFIPATTTTVELGSGAVTFSGGGGGRAVALLSVSLWWWYCCCFVVGSIIKLLRLKWSMLDELLQQDIMRYRTHFYR
jgi:hypothetical protein